ncbi:flagellar hook-length control protein FliK [Oceanicoccus sagamiensis]|uniref:Flagellar hook-length control protein-like C-terminal domain-containing protein n=1 Tax=Oceanicoccus sagamiensis TaxID=716816 RepID=A0A1X9NBN3_9GAMM|nr:flagellar hook-length control protein FliK [Oceanicoccus sagamiensis]ARN75440.1 hypothetical protein BST96_15760 [Oceanicoccus sagamiensis]
MSVSSVNAAVGALVQQILPQLSPAVVEAMLNSASQRATANPATMAVTVDSLINQLIPLKPTSGGNLAAAAKAGILEAVVISSQATNANTLTGKPAVNAELLKPAPPTNHATNNSEQQFKVKISANNQSFELLTRVPIPNGSKIQLSVAQNNLATILTIASPNPSQTLAQSAAPGQTQIQAQAAPTSTASKTTLSPSLTNPAVDGSARKAAINTPVVNNTVKTEAGPLNNRPAIEQGLRQALPQQQPLKNLLPLIQQIVQQPPQQIPKELLQNLNTLLQQFPTSQQAQQAKPLQQALNNNGIFFEAKLAQQPAKTANTNTETTRLGSTSGSPISQDTKALLQRLVAQVDKSTATSPPNPTSTTPSPLINIATTGSDEGKNPLTYSPAAAPSLTADIPIPASTSQASAEKNVDILLRQLSNQLLASLARTQLNQLESLAARQANTPDGQAPVNSWTMELPIVHGKNIDSLELRIDQHLIEGEEQGGTADGTKQWTVMLAFDLHALGRMNVQLKIIDTSVSAVVWSQYENTHREVQQQITSLSKSLEKVGVTVKQVDCQLGLPPKNNLPIYKQLVDVRT